MNLPVTLILDFTKVCRALNPQVIKVGKKGRYQTHPVPQCMGGIKVSVHPFFSYEPETEAQYRTSLPRTRTRKFICFRPEPLSQRT